MAADGSHSGADVLEFSASEVKQEEVRQIHGDAGDDLGDTDEPEKDKADVQKRRGDAYTEDDRGATMKPVAGDSASERR